MKRILTTCFALVLVSATTKAESLSETSVCKELPAPSGPAFYPFNAPPLDASPLAKLPPGAVVPRGWLRQQLVLDAGGIPGHLDEISRFLKFDLDPEGRNGWFDPKAKYGGEELAYWLRGYVDLGIVLQDARILESSKKWMEAILATAQPDGYFGPGNLKPETKDGVYAKRETAPHQILMAVLCSYYDYSGDHRILNLMTNYYKWMGAQPPVFYRYGWGASRWSDHLLAIHWLYNRTKNPELLSIATRIQENGDNWMKGMPTGHNVNFSQGFRMPIEYSVQSHDSALRDKSCGYYLSIMKTFGQVPGGIFGGDEGTRLGYGDPRQGLETCGFVELMQSFEIIHRITGDSSWMDRCEDIAFNSLPAALTPDHRALHYITSANSIELNNKPKLLGQFANGPFPMQAYEPSPHNYRCCTHNYGMGWPYFTESLWDATGDRGICAAMYAPCEVKAKVGDGTVVTVLEETEYPFRETIKFTVQTPKAVAFPLYFRIPGWVKGSPEFSVNGKPISLQAGALSYARIAREWKPGDVVELHFPMSVTVQSWPSNGNAFSVYYGPLNFSLAIQEKWTPYVPEKYSAPNWGGYEVSALSPWNYGLVMDGSNSPSAFEVVRQPGAMNVQPFTRENAPIQIKAKARRIDAWKADPDNVVGPLQQSPAWSDQPDETVTLIPSGAARLRITSFPGVTSAPDAHRWTPTPSGGVKISASYRDSSFYPGALIYGIEPKSSHDLSVPRFSWWNHQGTLEWVQFQFPGAVTVSAVAPYWFIDRGPDGSNYPHDISYQGETASLAPESWSVQYHDGKKWNPVEPTGEFGTAPDCFNLATFKPVRAYSLRIVARLAKNRSAGLYCAKIYDGKTQIVPAITSEASKILLSAAGSRESGPIPDGSYDASEISLADGSPVTAFPDSSPAGADAVYEPDKKLTPPVIHPPVLASKGINQLPAVRFDGTLKQGLNLPRPTGDDFTIAMVFQTTQPGHGNGTGFGLGTCLLGGCLRQTEDDYGISFNAKGQVLAGTGNPEVSLASRPGLNDGKPHLLIFSRVKANGGLSLSIDGEEPMRANSSNFTSLTFSKRLAIGALINGGVPFIGDVGAVLFFTTPLQDAERKALRDQLMKRWSIQ